MPSEKHECVFDYEFTNSETGEVLVNQLPPTWNTYDFGAEVGAALSAADASIERVMYARGQLASIGASDECLRGFDYETDHLQRCRACGEPIT